ncbi:MAG: hypothetical protein MJ154_02255 [Candidatus Saccharibacteria bacterium]|nr:hypothetical protein [Candidatus Saccharibacteria bacterium]
MPEKTPQSNSAAKNPSKNVVAQVADRIKDSANVLVALSNNPSVDELSAALGLTFVLDKLGKHATAIFSGAVPNAIEFLEPEKTFESNTNSLQDFIIALDKEKADHLRYKIEGDFVKVYITPYKTTLTENDLEFSHGDYNVDLIVALNVDAEADLDSALSEYGKIKHDASSINIGATAPGKFADLEWGDPAASSVSEMIANLADILDDGSSEEKLIDKSTATALLAGIVAATNRFSNERTTADTMSVAASLMTSGADQQLISSSIPLEGFAQNTVDINEELAEIEAMETAEDAAKEEQPAPAPADPTNLKIDRKAEAETPAIPAAPEEPAAPAVPAEPVIPVEPAPKEEPEISAKKPENVPDLPESEAAPVAPADETPVAPEEAPKVEDIPVPAPAEAAPVDLPTPELEPIATPAAPAPAPEEPVMMGAVDLPLEEEHEPEPVIMSSEKVILPPSEDELPATAKIDYAAAMEAELNEALPTPTMAPTELPTAEMAPIAAPIAPMSDSNVENATPVVNAPVAAPEAAVTPPTADFQASPSVDPAQPPVGPMGLGSETAEYVNPPLPMPSDGELLPPPPTPFSLDESPMPPAAATAAAPAPEPELPAPSASEFAQGIQDDVRAAAAQAAPVTPIQPIMPAAPAETPAVSPSTNGVNPVMQDQVYSDPSAFHIPGM